MPRLKNAPVIETERLRLRGHRLGDFDACAALWGDPVVVAKQPTRVPYDVLWIVVDALRPDVAASMHVRRSSDGCSPRECTGEVTPPKLFTLSRHGAMPTSRTPERYASSIRKMRRLYAWPPGADFKRPIKPVTRGMPRLCSTKPVFDKPRLHGKQ